jgi:glycosyltransferase involved in cell wall biosynthesis
VANNREMKGVPYLLKAMQQIKVDRSVHLLLIGKDMDTEENKAIASKTAPNTQVHFVGFQTNSLNWVKASDCFVLPSIFGESITKSVIEAMGLGVPALITDIPGNEELLEQDKSGWKVEARSSEALARGIKYLVKIKEKLPRHGQMAKEYVADFLSAERTNKKYAKLFTYLYKHGSIKGLTFTEN